MDESMTTCARAMLARWAERCALRTSSSACWILAALVVAAAEGCSSSPQDGSVVSGATKNNHPPIVRLVTIVPNPLILAGPITVHVVADDPDGTEPTKRFQWIINGAPVLGATGPELDPIHVKRSDQVALEVVALDGELESAPYRTDPIPVVNTPPLVSHVTVEADAEKTNRVFAKVDAADPDRDEIHYSYRWWRNDKQVKEGEEGALDTTGFGRKDVVVVEVTARDQDTAAAPVRSAPSALGNSPPLIVSDPASLTNREQYEYVVQAKDVDGDTVTYGLETGPPGMTVDKATGQVIWKVIPGVAGTHRVKIVAEDGQGGMAWQEFELSIPSTAQSQASVPPQG